MTRSILNLKFFWTTKAMHAALIALFGATLLFSCAPKIGASRSELSKSNPVSSSVQNFGLAAIKSDNTVLLDYIQSGFAAGRSYGPVGAITPDMQSKLEWTRVLSKKFTGSEILITDTRLPEHRRDIRDLSTALSQVSGETGKPFYGYYVVPRPPGFHWPEELAVQPGNFRAQALRSDGALLEKKPPPSDSDNQSLIAITGQHLDITNRAAVDDFMSKTRRVYSANCVPLDDCVGPLHGFIAYNENKLTEIYTPFVSGPNDRPDLQDYWPVHWEYTDIHQRYERLRAGHPFDLMVDGDPYFNFLNPPKRVVPLFSKNAADSFVKYAQSRGFSRMTKLPADRGEFNDSEADYQGEPRLKKRAGDPLGPDGWVQFVPLEDVEYWSVWEDWVHETWTGFMIELAKTYAEAQSGNPDYKGVIYFQLPNWYSIRGEAARTPINYMDGNGVKHSMRLIDSPNYKANNPAVFGIDMEKILQSPYIAGVLHETTNALPIYFPKTSDEQVERDVYNSDLHQELFLAKGFLLKQLAHQNQKIFGAFARYDKFIYGGQMSQTLYQEYAWEKTLQILKPDMVSTLPDFYYLTQEDVAGTRFQISTTQPESQTLGHIWLDQLAKLKEALIRNPWKTDANITLDIAWMQPGEASFGPSQGITLAGNASGLPVNTGVHIQYRVIGTGADWTDMAYRPLPSGENATWYASIPLEFKKDDRIYEVMYSYGSQTRACYGRVWDPASGHALSVECRGCDGVSCPQRPLAGDFGPANSVSIAWLQPSETSWGMSNSLTIAGYAIGDGAGVQLKYRLKGETNWNTLDYRAPANMGNHGWTNGFPLRFPKDPAIYEVEASFLGKVYDCTGSVWSRESPPKPLTVGCTPSRRRAVLH